MRQISLITDDDQFAQWFSADLQKDLDCKISHVSFVEHSTYDSVVDQSDILIVDQLTSWQPVPGFFQHLRQVNPGIFILGLVKNKDNFPHDNVILSDLDDVVERPPGHDQMCQIKKSLLSKIAILVRLADLQEKLRNELRQSQIIAKSPAMRDIMNRLLPLANLTSTVLITGETGTGKELIARAIHYLGPRAAMPFVIVDCGAIQENLVENELFGHVRGAYTDAGPSTRGLIEEAEGGTLFLDEIESLPLKVQSRFLRFLQERQFKPLGNSKYISVDARVLAATNADLTLAIKNSSFRQDLYYRLNVLPLFIPPLRQRKEDIPALVDHFIQLHTGENQDRDPIPPEILQSWLNCAWSGNVRELENTVQQWLMTREPELKITTVISETNIPTPIHSLFEVREAALAQCEESYFKQLMAHTKGNISLAAQLANIDRKSLGILLKKRGIAVNQFRS